MRLLRLCDVDRSGHLVAAYLDAVQTEIDRAVEGRHADAASTVFVGGGTPTLVPPERLAEVIASIPVGRCRGHGRVQPRRRVRGDVERLQIRRGQSRERGGAVDVGARAALTRSDPRPRQRDADRRGNPRSRDAVIQPRRHLRGGRREGIDDWTRTIEDVVALDPPHVSAYGLTIEAGTPLAGQPDRHPDDDDQADKYEIADELLSAAGLANYEVSNWARPGHESQHNFLYWRQHDYRGFGCAAHSHRSGRRWWSVRTPERYVDLVASRRRSRGRRRGAGCRDTTIRTAAVAAAYPRRCRTDSFTAETRALLDGLLATHPVDPSRVVLTRRGRLMANEISMRFA